MLWLRASEVHELVRNNAQLDVGFASRGLDAQREEKLREVYRHKMIAHAARIVEEERNGSSLYAQLKACQQSVDGLVTKCEHFFIFCLYI